MPSLFRRTPSAARPAPRTSRLGVEALEDRVTPTATNFDPYTVLPLPPDSYVLGLDVADFTGDGKLDVVAGFLNPGGPAQFAVFSNTGNGTFGPAQTFDAGTGAGGGAVAAADFNNDGRQDVVVTAYVTNGLGFGNRVSVNLGDGAGGFAVPIVFTTGGSDMDVSVADFNEDHNADLAIYTRDAGQLAVHFGDGTGHFPSATFIQVAGGDQFGGQQLAADLNGDGHSDLAISLANGTNQVKTYFGTGTGAFTPGPVLGIPIGAATNRLGLVVADLDEDGLRDLAVAAGTEVFVYRGTGGGNFDATPTVFAALPAGEAGVMDAADFDGDGHTDLAVSNVSDNVVAVLPGDGDGNLAAPEAYTVPPGSGSAQAFRAADLNGDGRPDIAAAAFSNTQPGVTLLLSETGRATPTVTVTGGSFTYDGFAHPATGSVTGVGGADLGTPTFTYAYLDDDGNWIPTANGGTDVPVDPGYYRVTAAFAGNANYNPASATADITIAYGVRVLTDLSKAFHAGRVIPIKIQLADAAGNNVSSTGVDVAALRLEQVNADGTSTPVTLEDAGNANPGNLFRYAGGGYSFNLSTKGLGAGSYKFVWTAGGDPTEHELGFRLV